MIKLPNTKEGWGRLGSWLGWILFRLQIIGLVVGVVMTLGAAALTGFWTFREQHQASIRSKYDAALDAHKVFEAQLAGFNRVFDGNVAAMKDVDYAIEAQKYIGVIDEATLLLPNTSDKLLPYVDAISTLTPFYSQEKMPPIGSDDWMLLYGKFRVDFDTYLKTRDAYFNALSSEVGDYMRYIFNS